MTISRVHLYRYRLNLKKPITVGQTEISKREGLILRAQTHMGGMGLGEIAPLPGLSRESLGEAEVYCKHWLKLLQGQPLPIKPIDLIGGDEGWNALPPSVQFGVSSVAAMLKHRNEAPLNVLGTSQSESVALNALLTSSGKDAAQEAEEALNDGYRAVKIKVGRCRLEEDIQTVEAVHCAIKGAASIRLDANGAWTFRDAETFALAMREFEIDYIEEPLDYWKLLFPFRLYTRMEYAVDETLHQHIHQLDPLDQDLVDEERQHLRQTLKRAKAHIIKPTLFGGLKRVAEFAELCSRPWSAQPVLSSAFESGLGLILLANLAAIVSDADLPAGLDTWRWFEHDVVPEPLPIERGRLLLGPANAMLTKIDFNRLEEVARA